MNEQKETWRFCSSTIDNNAFIEAFREEIMRNLTLMLLIAATFICINHAYGNILSVSEKSASLRSSPSFHGSLIVLEVPLNYPLKIIEENGEFYRVRDYRGRDTWVEKVVVEPTKSVIVDTGTANLRNGPGKTHEVIFKARSGVTFRVIKEQQGWLFVEHENGRKGWIFKNLVWGL